MLGAVTPGLEMKRTGEGWLRPRPGKGGLQTRLAGGAQMRATRPRCRPLGLLWGLLLGLALMLHQSAHPAHGGR